MVESSVRSKVKFEILRIIKIRSMQLFGLVPTDLVIKFKPLRVMSALDEETVKTSKFTRVMTARQSGEITSLEWRDAVNRDGLLPIQLDTTPAALDLAEEEKPAPTATRYFPLVLRWNFRGRVRDLLSPKNFPSC